jgi:hypothetical protein
MNSVPKTPSDWLVGAFKKNPEGLLLLAAGAVLLMRQSGNTQAQTVTRDATSLVAEAANGAKDYATNVADRTMRSASSMASAAADYASESSRKVEEQSERMFEQAQSALQDRIGRVVTEQPLMIAIAGLAAGAAIASAFPTTSMEKESLGPIADQVSEAASRVGEQMKEATANAGEALKKAADERGLNLDGAKEVAGEVANAFKDSMTGAGKSQDTASANKPDATQSQGRY